MGGGLAEPRRYEGRGKLLFFGEHSAVYGAPAIGVTLPLGIRIALEDGVGSLGRLWGVPDEYLTKFADLLDATRAILDYPKAFKGMDIRLESDLPPGSGLGSSAALCVAIMAAGARRPRAGGAATSEELWAYAHEAERLFHGKPSGIDTGLASGSGIAALYPRPRGLPEKRHLSPVPFWLVAGTVPRSGNARELIRGVGERYAEGCKTTLEAIRELGTISERAIAAFSSAGTTASLIEALAPHADAAQERLSALGLSTPALEEALSAGKRAGGRVAKLSGAGGGGAFFFIVGDGETAADVHAAILDLFRSLRTGDLLKPLRWTGSALEIDPSADVGFYSLRTT